jgi:acetoin utilization protein AcuB
MIVSKVMSKNPVHVHPEASATEAMSLMGKMNVSHLPVIDKKNKLIGILTKVDLLKAGPSQSTTLDVYEIGYLLTKIKVLEIMQKQVVTVDENEVVEEAARIMADKDIGCLPVMRGPLLVGIITDTDLFRVFVNAFGARHKGVRVILSIGEVPGQIAKVTSAIAEKNGNIVALVTSEGDDVAHRTLTIKVEDFSKSDMEAIIKQFPDVTLEDIREL